MKKSNILLNLILTWHKSTKNFGSSENFFNILWNNALEDKLEYF